jgi:hypothetical protein
VFQTYYQSLEHDTRVVDGELEAEGKVAVGALVDEAVETSAGAVVNGDSFDEKTILVVVELANAVLVEPTAAQVVADDVALGTAGMTVVVVVRAAHHCHEQCVDEKPIHPDLEKLDSHILGVHIYNVQPLPDVLPSLMSVHHTHHSTLMHQFHQGVLMKYIQTLSHQVHSQPHQMLVQDLL